MTLFRAPVLLLVFGLVPGTAFAQRGIMGGRGALTPGRGAGSLAREPGIQIPKYVNSLNLLIEHRQDLSLSDSQFVKLIAQKRMLDSANVPLLRKLDSVQRLFKSGVPMFSSPSAGRRDSIAEAKSFVNETLDIVRDHISAAREKAFGDLSSTQLTKARDIEDKAAKAVAAENERNQRSPGRGGGAGFDQGPAG